MEKKKLQNISIAALIIGALLLMLVIGIIFSCTVCSGLDSFADKLKSGAEQLNKDVAIGKVMLVSSMNLSQRF